MALNINRNVDDVFYRYKMPRLVAKVEGKGNGIKTVIANMPEIAKALNRPPTYPTKYFGCELGAQTQFDLKNERYIVNGEHDAGKLQDLLDGFIRKFVLCPGCENPETILTVYTKKNQISQACKACGYVGLINVKGRLTTFIIKNPPTNIEEPAADGPAAVKKGKGKRGKENGSGSPTEDKEEIGLAIAEDDSTNELDQDETGNEDEDEDWQPEYDTTDTGQEQLTPAIAALAMHPDMEKSLEDRLDMFDAFFLKAFKNAGSVENMNPKSIATEADRLDLREKAPLLVARGLFGKDVLKQIPTAKKLLTQFTEGNVRAQKYLLGGVEQLVSDERYKETLLPLVPHILKALYDQDIVEEETIQDWGRKGSKKYVSRQENKEILDKAAPFLQWLEEAEEESSDDEQENVEVEFEEAGRGAVKPVAPKPVQNGVVQNGKAAEEPDDFDIDNI